MPATARGLVRAEKNVHVLAPKGLISFKS